MDCTATRACPSCALVSGASRVNPTCGVNPGNDDLRDVVLLEAGSRASFGQKMAAARASAKEKSDDVHRDRRRHAAPCAPVLNHAGDRGQEGGRELERDRSPARQATESAKYPVRDRL